MRAIHVSAHDNFTFPRMIVIMRGNVNRAHLCVPNIGFCCSGIILHMRFSKLLVSDRFATIIGASVSEPPLVDSTDALSR